VRSLRMVLGVAALLVAMVVASGAPAFAGELVHQDANVDCPMVGVIADNGSAVNNTCSPLVVTDD
jgi:hypothetical protein